MSGAMWILHNLPETEPRTFRLSNGAIKTVGRAPAADLILDAALVSRIHCRLEAHDETIEVVDLESTNGTFVNGERIMRCHAIPGDRIKVGRVELVVGRSD
jgi:pSer/pThr/pTyr-binding forkhead associated (FHA) protein